MTEEAFSVFSLGKRKQGRVDDRGRQQKKLKIPEIAEGIDDKEKYQITEKKIRNGIHEYVAPKNWTRPPYTYPAKPAKEYPFVLDEFQTTAIECVERKESVLVAAHTSAGKTVVAEYAIAMALRDNQRVIYTSPIKALSNQKYRQLGLEFKDVGLMTGDVTMNPSAGCLVMTTEILRNMLYRGSEVVREMSWVIFDEIHYMRDKERGVVWEETIILLPPTVKLVFLSATIQNAREFAQWICTIKKQPCNVVYTELRPVPLQHYLMPLGGEGIYMVVNEDGKFVDDNFQRAIQVLSVQTDKDMMVDPKGKKLTSGTELGKLVKLIIKQHYDPCIIFSFSKRHCEAFAVALNDMDFNKPEEKSIIEKIYSNAMKTLSEEDQQLPMIKSMLPLLKRGIGVHHGGLLPIVKEVIEILFQEGKIKILFTTETFSMGINMPAKTVVFTSVEKFDGEEFRYVRGGEYIQMSGRAGRRGLDDKGIVIMMVDKRIEPDIAKEIIMGKADPLNSEFRLSYNMLLNLQRIEDVEPKSIIQQSFRQFQNERALPLLNKKLQQLTEQKKQIKLQNKAIVSNYLNYQTQIQQLRQQEHDIIIQPHYSLPFLIVGRVVHVAKDNNDWGWGVVINYTKKRVSQSYKRAVYKKEKQNDKDINIQEKSDDIYIVDVLLYAANINTDPKPASIAAHNGEFGIIPLDLSMIWEISTIQLKILGDFKAKEKQNLIGDTLSKLLAKFKYSPALLNPIDDMEINDSQIKEILHKIAELNKLLQSVPKPTEEDEQKYQLKQNIKKEIISINNSIEQYKKMVMAKDLENMQRVLRRLEFMDKNQILLKGKVACCIDAADELVATELIFNGTFNNMDPSSVVALCSCLIFTDSKSEAKMTKNSKLKQAYDALVSAAERIGNVKKESSVDIDLKDYIESFKIDLMDSAYEWCKGAKFIDLCKNTDVYEGTIIRCFRRLEECLEQIIEASKAIGNSALAEIFAEGSKTFKRDIVFASSLYL